MTAPGGWLLVQSAAAAGDLHRPWPPSELHDQRVLRRCQVTGRPALVLGSAQNQATVDHDALMAAGVDLVRRHSGGGAVALFAGAQLWLDVWLPRRDPLWRDDVVDGAFWVGDVWAAALGSLGVEGAEVHRRRATSSTWSSLVCFAAMGPGEVAVKGRKVVGLSQHRSRAGVRFQTLALGHWDPSLLPDLLALSPDERRRVAAETADVATGLDQLLAGVHNPEQRLETLASAVIAHLP